MLAGNSKNITEEIPHEVRPKMESHYYYTINIVDISDYDNTDSHLDWLEL